MMLATPGFANKAAGTTAVAMLPNMFPALSVGSVVARVCPFHCTTVLATKVPPLMVIVRSAQGTVVGTQALMAEGEMDVIEAPVFC